ncbi:MAG: prevent-host-death protein [Chloroflexota bacterium]|jgi:antitoxin (DNA-binding transcriptional repressor) of toxin-antitoxin stability system
MQKTMSKKQLGINMLEVFRELELSGDELIVTDENTPVLRIVPIQQKKSVQELFGEYQGKVIYYEDINTPTIDEC